MKVENRYSWDECLNQTPAKFDFSVACTKAVSHNSTCGINMLILHLSCRLNALFPSAMNSRVTLQRCKISPHCKNSVNKGVKYAKNL